MDKAGRKIDELKDLWQVSFGDTEEYTDFFFNHFYLPENTITREVEGRIVSASQFKYFDIICGRQTYKSVYILGVCTHPDHRRKGLSTSIVEQILSEQSQQGIDIAFLIPQEEHLFNFYRKMGFKDVFIAEEEIFDKLSPRETYSIIKPSKDDLFNFYTDFYLSLGKAAMKERDYFSFAMDDVSMGGGRVDVCGSNGKILGFAASYGNLVRELLCCDDTARYTLLSLLYRENGGQALTVYSPIRGPASENATRKTIGMAQVINPALSKEKVFKDLYGAYANLLLN